jgi:PAS domain S-box-containing protein
MSSFRERLFRPYRWRLWVQFALLGAFVLIVPIVFTSQRLLESGREVLIAHEIIDLSDESNLRVNEFREDLAYLAVDVKKKIAEEYNAANLKPELDTISKSIGLPEKQNWQPPTTVNEARRRYLHGTNAGVYRFEYDQGKVQNIASRDALATDPAVLSALKTCFADAAERLAKSPLINRSGFHYIPGENNKPGRTVLAFTEKHAGTYFTLLLDFSRYVWNRQQISPRHFYLVLEPNGRVLIRPDIKATGERPLIEELVGWEYPKFEKKSWFDGSLKDEDRKQRLAFAVRDGGNRLKAVEVPSLSYFYQKGSFSTSADLSKMLGKDKAIDATKQLNTRMTAALATDHALRVGEASPLSSYIELSHPDASQLKAVKQLVLDWWRDTTNNPKASIDWTAPIVCKTLQGQLVPLRVDLNDEFDPAWFIIAASTEELKEDIDDRFNSIFREWVLPTLIISIISGLGLVYMVTRSLNNLAEAARKRDDNENPKPMPVGGPYEVSALALTLNELAKDVQERDRELRDRAARYETILRAAGEGIIITSSNGTIEEANKAAGRMFGFKPDQLIGMSVNLLMKQPIGEAGESSSLSLDPLATVKGLDTAQGVRVDGSTFWLDVSLKPVMLRDRVVNTMIFRDISLRKESEERIRKLNDELENRVKERTTELESSYSKLEVALKQAEAASQAKDTFVANMSHELRQPLHIIIGFTEAMREDAADLKADQMLPDLNKVLAAAKHLLELINDILDMSKIASGKMELALDTFPVEKLLGEVKTLIGPLAAKNDNRLDIVVDQNLSEMKADERRVRQMLINLLSNAFKFTSNGTVSLKVSKIADQGKDWIRFSVADTGKGMSTEQVGRLFQRFYQADSSTTRGQGGTGLGLAITQSFNELMGGQPIRVSSQQYIGSEFILTLPLVVEPATERSTPRKVEAQPLQPQSTMAIEAADGRVVLVIDDDSMVRELMERFLRKEGFEVVLASNGQQGLALAKSHQPCLITLDVMMPDSDGWAVLGDLKADPATADIPVVMLTIVDDRGRGFALGAADYLTKPIDWQRLGSILRKYLNPERNESILVIDDDQGNRELLCKQLHRDGWKTIEAENGEQGLAAFEQHRPGLILLDLMMPVMDGFGFLDELNKRLPHHRVPVVVLTAKELNSQDFDRLNGRVARIIEKGDLTQLDHVMELIRRTAKRPLSLAAHQEPRRESEAK